MRPGVTEASAMVQVVGSGLSMTAEALSPAVVMTDTALSFFWFVVWLQQTLQDS